MQEEGDDGRLQGDGVTAGGAEGRLGRHATVPLLYTQYLLGPPSWSEYEGKSVVGCADIRSRPNDAFMSSAAPRAIGHSDKFCVWSSFSFTALPVQYYSSLAVHAKIGGDKIGASVARVQGPSQATAAGPSQATKS